MKNLTPSGYQGFPALFNGLFGGVALLFRRLAGRQSSAILAEQKQKESTGLKPISSSIDKTESRHSGNTGRH
jgi:hypothetical protein